MMQHNGGAHHDIIVIGASAGGVEALMTVARGLAANLAAAVFVVLHIPAHSPSSLPVLLNRAGPLKALHPADQTPVEYGHIYVAPPDHHLLINDGLVRVVRSAKENHHRPAIDPLFRSAARWYGPRVIGVVLTGSLDDGTSGLAAIKERGGLAVVQDPAQALYSSMPQNALARVAVDAVLPLTSIAEHLVACVRKPAPADARFPVSSQLEAETRVAELEMNVLNTPQPLVGTPSNFSCPGCGGVLNEIQEAGILRFRCRVGHAYSSESMFAEQGQALERALWTALNTLEENAQLSRRLEAQAREHNSEQVARRFAERVRQAEQHATQIRNVLFHDLPLVTSTPVPQAGADGGEIDM